MKLTVLLIFLTVFSGIAADSYSQSKLTLKFDNVQMEELLGIIEDQSEFRFFYNDEINLNEIVSLDASNETISDILDEIFSKSKINYEIVGRQIILTSQLNQNQLMSQQQKISGKVTDNNNQALPGVTVVVKGTTNGTITDFDGNYTIPAVPSNATLVFSFVGLRTIEISVAGKTSINVKMEEDAIGIEEVVAIGYGVQKKSDVTGALVSVSAEELTSRPVNNTFEALQGRAAGVDITSNERPGEVGKIYIRGQRSLNATNTPLYVVDGVPLASGGIETINPRDIESIEVLKDASATAIYGSRGANGVIIITTKSGRSGEYKINYSGTMTMENIVDKAPSMSASEYITWRRWAYYNSNPNSYPRGDQPTIQNDKNIFASGLDDTMSWPNIEKGWSGNSWDGSKVTNTDWTDFVTQTGITQEHTLSVSGGTEKMNSYVSFGYLNNKGTQIGQEFERYNAKLSVNITPQKWFSMGGSINGSWSIQDYGYSRTGQSSSSGPVSIYDAAKQIVNYALPYNEDGEIIMYPGGQSTVYTIIDEWKKSNDNRQRLRVLGSLYAGIDFGKIIPELDGLKFRTNFGQDFSYFRKGIYIDSSSAVRLGGTSYASWAMDRKFSWTLDNIITYDKVWDMHKVGVTLLQSASAYNYESGSMSEQNVPKPSYLWNNMGAVDITSTDAKAGMGTGLTDSQLTSYMARVNYSLHNKYLLTLSGRYDGSSVLAAGHKWAFFPSAALGWRVDQEDFMQDVDLFEQLKMRLGFGSTGNSAVSPYQTLGEIQSFYVPFGGAASNALAYATNEPYYTSSQVSMANPLLGWETTTQYNLGVDFSMLHGRVSGTIDVYTSHTTDLLMKMTIPTITGYPNTWANVGETKNKGIDITLNLVPVKTANFTWDLNINTAYQNDEIVELANGKQDMVDNSWFIGESISLYYGYQADGLWQAEEADEMAKFNANGQSFQAGKVKPVDQNGDYIMNQEDRVILGNQLPKWTLGLNNNFSYKNFELSFMLYGRFGYMVSTGGEGQLGMYQQRKIDYWTPDNTNAEWQKPIYNQSGGDSFSGLLGFRDASFLKIRNISLAYNVPAKACRTLGINNLKVYSQVKNMGTLYSSVDWLDLDLGGSTFNRGFVFGVEVEF